MSIVVSRVGELRAIFILRTANVLFSICFLNNTCEKNVTFSLYIFLSSAEIETLLILVIASCKTSFYFIIELLV